MNRDPLSFRHTARCVSEPLHVRLQQWVALRLVPTLLTALLFAALLALLHANSAAAATAKGGDYKLGPQDQVRLLVFEWRANVDTVFAWSSLNDEFTVGASGMISLPILGEVEAAGKTTVELAQAVGERLKGTIGLAGAPKVGVEVVKYRPFYIMGGVNKPGAYPYRPGLTVLQAVSVAHGLLGSGESGLNAGREAIQARGKLQLSAAQIVALLARKARLSAELKNEDKIRFPDQLEKRKKEPAVAVAIKQEQTIFNTRRSALKTEINALEQLKSFLEKEVVSIEAQIQTQVEEQNILKKELASITALVGRGLAPATRQLEMQRTVSRLEGDRLRLESTLLTAKQGISRAEVSIIEARNKRANAVAADLRTTQDDLDTATSRYATSERLLYESALIMPQAAGKSKGAVTYAILRDAEEIPATETTAVQPGDTVKVQLPLPKGLGLTEKGEPATQ